MIKRKIIKIEYNIEQSPFYDKNAKLRASLKELKASDGEDIVLARKRYFKQDEYTKVIVSSELDIKAYNNLSSISKTILYYIQYDCLEYNSPTFRLKAEDVADILEVDTSMIFKGLKELVDLKYIARTKTREVYWINHNRFYKGNYVIDKFLKQK